MFTSKYVLDTVLLKQQKWSILEIAGFFFRTSTQGKAEVISNTGKFFCFNSNASNLYNNCYNL
jgi:hypothetical protein